MSTEIRGRSGMVEIDRARRTFRVRREVYRSPAIFEQELERVFGRCWLFIGHESEIEKPGAYVSRRVALRDLILVRSRNLGPRAYYNSCTHRGVLVCRERAGSAKVFTCPYHGWVFNTDGKLVHQGIEGGYGEEFNIDGRYDLVAVPRLEHYRGFYFVNFNPRAISLHDYLAGAKEYIDLVADQTDIGHELISVPHEYSIEANYKYLAENSYDGYHGVETHRSYFEFLGERLKAAGQQHLVTKMMADYPDMGEAGGLGMGHGYFWQQGNPSGKPVAAWHPSWGPDVKETIESIRARLEARYGNTRMQRICEIQKNLVIFPNLVINDHLSTTVRMFQPESPTRMRVTAWAIGPKDEIPALRKVRLENFLTAMGPAGFASPDDNEMLELAQRGITHTPIQWSDISRGMHGDDDLLTAQRGWTDECQMRAYWTQWDRIMSGEESLSADA